MIIEFLISRWPNVFGEPESQRAANIEAGRHLVGDEQEERHD